jgi:gas vesicle protein
MEWLTLVGTLSGGILGVGSTLLVDRARAKRERGHRFDEVRRNAYTSYLVSLTETDAAMQILALGQATPIDRATVMSTFRSKSLLAHRYQAALVAPPDVTRAIEKTYEKLRRVREALITETLTVGKWNWETNGSSEWVEVHQPYGQAVEDLRAAMRDDIQEDEKH